ncbi:hypothetical protein TKK_0000934 [Trichogramma kaykai]|uniref:Large ribosomal subunit protein bL19m n=1 Tax=Trichogramma kaykai TaxID=54128 RepID=A0ABD2VX29_9HYME
MAMSVRVRLGSQFRNIMRVCFHENRHMSTAEIVVEKSENPKEPERISLEEQQRLNDIAKNERMEKLLNMRFAYQEFLPDPNPKNRNTLKERLERRDMLARRSNVEIPEFYVGSLVAVMHSDPHAPGKNNRFMGICIQKIGAGLRASFILRNFIDGEGVEINFDMYDPTIQRIDVIRLEKRLDEELFYLRDAPPEYSTFPVDMEPEYQPEGSAVPVNEIKVPLKPLPWLVKWERMGMKGIRDVTSMLTEKRLRMSKLKQFNKPWEKYDLLKMYSETIPIEDQVEIFSEIQEKLHELEQHRYKMKRSRNFVKPTKMG